MRLSETHSDSSRIQFLKFIKDSIIPDERAAAAAVGTVAAAILLMMPPPNAIAPGSAPPNAPQPGTPGGGGLPTNVANNPCFALSLVPAGLTAVAVFPPFETLRTFNATAVIFSENPRRKKREIYEVSSNSNKTYEGPSIFRSLLEKLVSSKHN